MLCATSKPLHSKITELIPNTLYQVEETLYVLGNVNREELEKYKDKEIAIDGYSHISLENWLNLNVLDKENIKVVY